MSGHRLTLLLSDLRVIRFTNERPSTNFTKEKDKIEERKKGGEWGWKIGGREKREGNVAVARRSCEVYRAFEFMYSQRAPVPAILRLSLVCPPFHRFFFCVSSLLCLPLSSCNCSPSLYPFPSAVLGITKRCNGKWGKDIS